MRLHFPALILALISASTAYRLSGTVVPLSYTIHLNLTQAVFTPESDEYTGYEIILVQARQATNEIQIHGAHDFINITRVYINSVDVASMAVDNATDIITLTHGSLLTADVNYTLYIEFTSRVSTQDMYGFYKSSYTYNDETKYLVTTQFQPVYARRAFPCFDEPAFKATFDILITYPEGMTALCNMPGELHDTSDLEGNDPTLTSTQFATTGIMPSYLVAFIVSEFTCSAAVNVEVDSVPHRICSRDETSITRVWSVEIGPPLLRSLNTFTDLNYGSMGFPKMDQVAIPDFAAGAMENWGLVTYREQYLLYDPVESTNMDQQFIATIISHEFAHMWWGNLVTLRWWSEMFLNEGFATYFEYFTTHDVFPEWELDKQFVVRVLQRALETDSLQTSPALQAPANSDAQVMSRFSQISYLKGGSVFRMVEHIMGTNNFIAGLRTYLSTYAFQNTIPENLWDTLDAQLTGTDRARLPDNTNLGRVMENWVVNPGYPILDVRLVNSAVVVRQEGRFLLNGNDADARWYVPISYASNLSPSFDSTLVQEWLEPIGFVEIPFVFNANGWIILNNHATGFYRVNYNNLWDNVIAALQATAFSGIPDVNRASIVDDAFQLARSDKLNYTRVFDIIEFLKNDTSHYPWFPAINGFNFLLRRVGENTRLGEAIANHHLDLLSNIYSTVPWTVLNNADHVYTLKQVDVLTAACRLGLTNCINHAQERFGEFRISGVRPSKNLRSVVYCNALRYGDSQADWILLWDAYHTTEVASEKVRILSALGCTQDEYLLEEYLRLTLDEEYGIRSQDALSVFTSVYTGSSIGVDVAFKFLQENHQVIEERYQSLNALRNMITGLAERFTTQVQIDELRQFIATGSLGEDFHSAANAALVTAEANQQWLSQSWDELHHYYGLDPTETEPPLEETTAASTLPPVTEDPTESSPQPTTEPPVQTTTSVGATAFATSLVLIVLSVVIAMG